MHGCRITNVVTMSFVSRFIFEATAHEQSIARLEDLDTRRRRKMAAVVGDIIEGFKGRARMGSIKREELVLRWDTSAE